MDKPPLMDNCGGVWTVHARHGVVALQRTIFPSCERPSLVGRGTMVTASGWLGCTGQLLADPTPPHPPVPVVITVGRLLPLYGSITHLTHPAHEPTPAVTARCALAL